MTSISEKARWIFGRMAFSFDRLNIDTITVFNKVARKESAIPHLFGVLMVYMAIALVPPLLVCIYYHEDPRPWIFPILLSLLSGVMLLLRYRAPENTRPTEAMFVVSTCWLMLMVIGAIPYVMYGMSIVDALFETMSGFTTTGASIMGTPVGFSPSIASIESWPKSILFWRSFTNWLGGAGIVMVFVTILPMLGVGGRNLFKNEFPGLDVQNFSMRIQEEARKFHYIYILLSILMVLLLLFTGVDLFDSLCVMFSALATGGFSTHTESIAFFSGDVQWIVTFFMFVGGVNFYLHYQAIALKNPGVYAKSSEFKLYALLAIGCTLLIAIMKWGDPSFTTIESALRISSFQVVNVLTCTGFATADYVTWEKSIVFLLLALMVIGGCTGSTAGGIKTARFYLSKEFISSALHKTVHPRSIFTIRMDGRPLSQEALSSVVAMVMCYFATALAAVVALMLLGVDPTTSMSAAVATLSNAGPGIGILGPYGTYGVLPEMAKVVLIFTMWAGRLEFITVLVLFTPVFWKELLRYRERYV